MRDPIRKIFSLMLVGAATLCVSCAHEKPSLVDDPNAKKEGALPWNKQESWETQGSLQAGVSDHR
jgi:hypothetical protein